MVSINVWHGISTKGFFKLREYESEERRKKRFELLVDELKRMDPDIIFIQEANPLPHYAIRLEESLDNKDYFELHHRANAGIKIGNLGIPININEGLVFLIKREWKPLLHKGYKLSGSLFSFTSNLWSFQVSENRYMMAAMLKRKELKILIFNLHLHAGFSWSKNLIKVINSLRQFLSYRDYISLKNYIKKDVDRRIKEMEKAIKIIRALTGDSIPFIVAGDFNATDDSEEIKYFIKELNLKDVFRTANPDSPGYTSAVKMDTCFDDKDVKDLKEYLKMKYEREPKRIDYIFVSKEFEIIDSDIIFNTPKEGIFISDHYGVAAVLKISHR